MMSREVHHGAFTKGRALQNVRFRNRIGRQRQKKASIPPPHRAGAVPGFLSAFVLMTLSRGDCPRVSCLLPRWGGEIKKAPIARGLSPVSCHWTLPRESRNRISRKMKSRARDWRDITRTFWSRSPYRAGAVPGFLSGNMIFCPFGAEK